MIDMARKIKMIFAGIIIAGCFSYVAFVPAIARAAENTNVGIQVLSGSFIDIQISNVVASNITRNTAKVSWETAPATECELSYGRTLAFSDGSYTETSPNTSHSYDLTGLFEGDRYYYKIHCEVSGNEKDSGNFEFDTASSAPTVDISVDTQNKKAEFSGTGRSGWTVNIKVTGESNFFKTVTCDPDGSWSYKTGKLDAGKYYVEVYYTNEHGAESPMSDKESFTIDEDNNEDNNGKDEDSSGSGGGGAIIIPPADDDEDDGGDDGSSQDDSGQGGQGAVIDNGMINEEVGIIEGREKTDGDDDLISRIAKSLADFLDLEGAGKFIADATDAMKETAQATSEAIARNKTQVNVLSSVGVAVGTLPFLLQLNSLRDIGLLFKSISSVIFGIFINRKRRDWGVIYDSRDGKPIPLAVISIFTADGRLAEKKVSDSMGTYSFLVPSGQYSIKAEKKGYEFQPVIINPGAYHVHNYEGQLLDVKKDDIIKNDIPLKPQVAKVQRALLSRKITDFLSSAAFFCGLTLSLVAVILQPTIFNTIIIIIYSVSGAIRIFAGTGAKWGTVYGNDGVKASFAIIKAFDKESGKLIARTITDEHGRYYLILGQGRYNLEVSSSILAGQSWTGEISLAKRAAVKKKIELG